MEHRQDTASFYASPAEALKAPPEEFLYVACLHEGTGVEQPDFLAVVDVHPESDTYGQIVHETPMPNVGDELHHFGWNRCSSACHGPDRSHLIVPGFRSSRIHIVDVADDPRKPEIAEGHRAGGDRLARPATRARTPSTACRATSIMISMLGDAERQRRRAASPCSTQGRSRSPAAGRGGTAPAHSTTTSGTSPART